MVPMAHGRVSWGSTLPAMGIGTLERVGESTEILTGEERLERAIFGASTLGEAYTNLQQETAEVISDDTEVYGVLRERLEVLAGLLGAYGSVRIARLPAGVLGMAPIGGATSGIHLSADLLLHGSAAKLREVCTHEWRHTQQAKLAVGDASVLFTPTKEVKDESVLYEGDTETYTGPRDDRPAAVYGEGVDVFQELAGYRGRLNDVMLWSGDVSALQNDIWREELRRGGLHVRDLVRQSEKTGYSIRNDVIEVQIGRWAVLLERGEVSMEDIEEYVQCLDADVPSEDILQRLSVMMGMTREEMERDVLRN